MLEDYLCGTRGDFLDIGAVDVILFCINVYLCDSILVVFWVLRLYIMRSSKLSATTEGVKSDLGRIGFKFPGVL